MTAPSPGRNWTSTAGHGKGSVRWDQWISLQYCTRHAKQSGSLAPFSNGVNRLTLAHDQQTSFVCQREKPRQMLVLSGFSTNGYEIQK